MNSGIVQEARAATPGQVKELAMTLVGAVPGRMTFDEATALIRAKGALSDGVRQLVMKLMPSSTCDYFSDVVIGGVAKLQLLDELKASHVPDKNVPKVWAVDMVRHEKFMTSSHMSKLTLVTRTPKELRFERGPYLREIYVRALEEGLQLCPPEVGVRLWLNQEKYPFAASKFYYVAMEPIPAEGLPGIFAMYMGDRFNSLHADQGLARDFFLDDTFIFVKP